MTAVPFAFLNVEPGALVGGIFFMIPIVAILTKHQQKMAMIYRENASHNSMPNEAEQRILSELASLRAMVNQQSIVIDDLARRQALSAPSSTAEVRSRIEQL